MARAVMIRTLEFDKGRELSQAEITELMSDELERLKKFVVKVDSVESEVEVKRERQIENSYEKFLLYNRDNPGRSVTEQKQVLKGDIEEFIEKAGKDGVIKTVDAKKGRGRPWTLIEFTEKGHSEIGLQKVGKDIVTFRWQRIVIPDYYEKWLPKDYKFYEEYSLSSKNGNERCDGAAIKREGNIREIAIEIENRTSVEWAVHNLEKCLDAGFKSVISCVEDKQRVKAVLKLAQSKISREQIMRVKVILLSEFVSTEPKENLLP